MPFQVGEIQLFGVEDSVKIFRTMTTGFYKNQIRSIVRELCSNAVDVHNLVGNEEPFNIHIPNQHSQNFIIRDFGTGLSHDDICGLFTVFGKSNKADTACIGGFGLGAKTPFIYSEQVIVRSFYNGEVFLYNFHLSNGFPEYHLLSVENTDEPNGLEITIPCPVEDDWLTWRDHVVDIVKYLPVKANIFVDASVYDSGFFLSGSYVVSNLLPDVVKEHEERILLDTKHVTVFRKSGYFGGVVLNVKNIIYSNLSGLCDLDFEFTNLDNSDFLIMLKADDIKLQRSREDILKNDVNSAIVNRVSKLALEDIINWLSDKYGMDKYSPAVFEALSYNMFLMNGTNNAINRLFFRMTRSPNSFKTVHPRALKTVNASFIGNNGWGNYYTDNVLVSRTKAKKTGDALGDTAKEKGIEGNYLYIAANESSRGMTNEEFFERTIELFIKETGFSRSDFNFIFDDTKTNSTAVKSSKKSKDYLCARVFNINSDGNWAILREFKDLGDMQNQELLKDAIYIVNDKRIKRYEFPLDDSWFKYGVSLSVVNRPVVVLQLSKANYKNKKYPSGIDVLCTFDNIKEVAKNTDFTIKQGDHFNAQQLACMIEIAAEMNNLNKEMIEKIMYFGGTIGDQLGINRLVHFEVGVLNSNLREQLKLKPQFEMVKKAVDTITTIVENNPILRIINWDNLLLDKKVINKIIHSMS